MSKAAFTLDDARAEIERMRDACIEDYRSCLEDNSQSEAAMYDARASALSRALGILDRIGAS